MASFSEEEEINFPFNWSLIPEDQFITKSR